MQDYQRQFIRSAIDEKVLCFGEFTLKSGRISPYFLNLGLFNSARALSMLGEAYAKVLADEAIAFDMLFGPAYKGIPLVSSTAVACYNHWQKDARWCFNRKEVKDHGEGGNLVGAPLSGKVVIIDDVITAGTAIREVLPRIEQTAKTTAIVVAIDRQECADHCGLTAVGQIQAEYSIPVFSIVTLKDIMTFISEEPDFSSHLPAMQAYQKKYCTLS